MIGDNIAGGSVDAAGNDQIDARDGNDALLGDNVNFFTLAPVGSIGRNDTLDGGSGRFDYCDANGGIDTAADCELVLNVP